MNDPKFKKLSKQASDIATASPQVIAERLYRMALAGTEPSTKDLREFYGMGAEKVLAVQQSCMAMSVELTKAHQRRIMSLFSSKGMSAKSRITKLVSPVDMYRTTMDVLNHGLTPFRSKVVANAKRLKRK